MKKTLSITRIAKHVFLFGYSLITVIPLFWVFASSLKPTEEILSASFSFPKNPGFKNYVDVWTQANLGRDFFNSLILTIATIAITLIITSMVSYVLGRVSPNALLYTFFATGIMIPIQAIVIPAFIQIRFFGLFNTRLGLISMYVVSNMSLAIFILTAFVQGIPKELEEAAVMDGASRSRIFFSVITPLLVPALSTVGILTFLNCWNEYLFALVLISKEALYTITLGIYSMKGEYSTNYGAITAGLAIAIIPVVLMYVLFQEKVVEGMTAGALKG